jgi:ribonuclease P protein component
MPKLFRLHEAREEASDEAHVSTEPAPPEEDARLPRAHEDQGRTQGAQAPARQGAETADCLTGRFPRSERLTGSADIQTLFQQGKRIDRPLLTILWRETEGPRRAAFAVTRQIRGSVRRNRARRRLREAYRAGRAGAPAGVAVMVVAKRGVLDADFVGLTGQLRNALEAIPGARTTR